MRRDDETQPVHRRGKFMSEKSDYTQSKSDESGRLIDGTSPDAGLLQEKMDQLANQRNEPSATRRVSTRRRVLATSTALLGGVFVAGCSELPTDGGGGGVDNDDDEDQQDDDDTPPGGDFTPTPAGEDLRHIEFGQTREGLIDEDDPEGPGHFEIAEPVEFMGQEGDGTLISQQSDEIDTYLILEGPGGDVVIEDDDDGEGYNSQARLALPSSGTYTIWAGSYDGDETGSYTLSVSRVSIDEQEDLRSIQYGETRDGYIDIDDPQGPGHLEYGEPVEFSGQESDDVRIEQLSDEIDCYLYLTAPGGEVVGENDDGGENYDSRMEVTLGTTGTYTIWAGSYNGDETGPYQLSLGQV